MKKRIITAAVLVPLLIGLVLAGPKILSAVVLGVLLAVAVYELLYRTEYIRQPRLVIYGAVMAFGICIWSIYGAAQGVFVLMNLAYFSLLFGEMMADHIKVRLEAVGLCILGGEIIPYMLSSVLRILGTAMGRYFVLLPFTVAFLSDAGAYFAGLKFGRHKIAPVISPNKTLEGVVGGLVFSTAGMLIYGGILALACKLRVNFLLVLLYGLAGSAVGTFGDLCFSAIKRQTGIKDYGNLIPGHGGVLDRLDSLVTVAPLIEALLLLLPLAV